MRLVTAALLSLACLFPLRADEQLKNPDFADGRSHWEGDGESASVASDNANPLDPTDSSHNAGLLLKLDGHDWVKITQDFRPLAASGVLTISYRLSDGLAFSTDFDDYKNIPHQIGYDNFQSFDLLAGQWIMTVFESADTRLKYYTMKPKATTDPQSLKIPIEGLVVRDDKTICLAFPPGKGTVTILHVGLESP